MSRSSKARREGTPPEPPEPLPSPVLDSHCHLDIMGGATYGDGALGEGEGGDAGPEQVDDAVRAQLAAARSVGIATVVQVGVDLASSRWSAEVADRHRDVWAAVALHPNEAGRGAATDDALREIERLAGLPQVRAVGETGLDHFRTPDPADQRLQEASFRAHVAIAKSTGTALVIHDRDAHDDVLRVLAEEGAPERTVFHCFSGDAAMARTCVDAGYVLSFAGTVTFANAAGLREAAALCPPAQMLVETDAPFLTPHPFRGRPNAPYLVPLTMRVLAEATGTDLDELCRAVRATGERVFGPL